MKRAAIAVGFGFALLVASATYLVGWYCNLKGYVAGYEDGRRDTILLMNLRSRLSDTTHVSTKAVD
jgi:hypothetical protein